MLENINVSDRLIYFRNKFKKSKIDISFVLSISDAQYGKYENGFSNISVKQLLKLFDFYEITPNEFFDIKEKDLIPNSQWIRYSNLDVEDKFMIDSILDLIEKRNSYFRK